LLAFEGQLESMKGKTSLLYVISRSRWWGERGRVNMRGETSDWSKAIFRKGAYASFVIRRSALKSQTAMFGSPEELMGGGLVIT